MATEHIQKGGVGVRFTATIKKKGVVVDVSTADGANEKKLLFQKPDGTTLTKDATFTTDGTDGKIFYDTEDATILNPAGAGWEFQGYVILTDPRNITVYSERKGFIVEDNIDTV